MELLETCDFKDRNEEIQDRLVIGILDKELSLELQLKADLTLENCVDRVRNSEMVKRQNVTGSNWVAGVKSSVNQTVCSILGGKSEANQTTDHCHRH